MRLFGRNVLLRKKPVLMIFALGIGVTACGSKSEHQALSPSRATIGTSGLGGPQDFLTGLAGGDKGNGGDAVVCFSDSTVQEQVRLELFRNQAGGTNSNPFAKPETMRVVSSVELLDLYEYKLPNGFPPKRREVMKVDGTFQETVPAIFSRLEKKSAFATTLRDVYKTIPLNHWHASPGVVEINDSSQAFLLPSECLLIQVAARISDQVYYDEHLWNKMDELNHTALVLHELIYKIAVDHGDNNSQKARQIVGLAMSKDEFEQFDAYQVYKKLAPLGSFFSNWNIEGNQVQVQRVVSESDQTGIPNRLIVTPAAITIRGTLWNLRTDDRSQPNIETDHSGHLTRIYGAPQNSKIIKFAVPGFITFENGQITKLIFGQDQTVEVEINGRKWNSVNSASIINEKLRQIVGTTLISNNMGRITTSGNTTLDESGQAILWAEYGTFPFGKKIQVNSTDLKFDKDGQLIQAKNVQCTDTPCNHASDEVELSNGMFFYTNKDDFEFYPNGEVARIEFAATTNSSFWFGSVRPEMWFHNVVTVELEPGLKFKRAKFDANGIVHQGTEPRDLRVPNKWVRLSDNGQVIIED